MAHCICCGGNVDIVGRLTVHAGLPDDNTSLALQEMVSEYAFQKYRLNLECSTWNVDWDVCYRCYVFSGAERYYPFSILPQYRY